MQQSTPKIDNTGSPEYKKPSKTFVRPEWKGKKKKLKIKSRSQNLDPLSIPYCVNRNKDAFCCLFGLCYQKLNRRLGLSFIIQRRKTPFKDLKQTSFAEHHKDSISSSMSTEMNSPEK